MSNDLPSGIAFDPADLKRRVEELAPWHYCHQFPHHILTGTCQKETTHPKLVRLLKAGAFTQPRYPSVLDLGSNSGIISMWFCDHKGSHVVAVENGERYYPQLELAIAAKGYTAQIMPLKMNIINLPKFFRSSQDGKPFDLVLFLGTMHHISPEYHEQIFRRCYQALRPGGGEFVVQTKTDLPVMELFERTGFVEARQIYINATAGRAAWKAIKPDFPEATAVLTRELKLSALSDDEFRLWAVEAIGYLVLLVHWLRGRLNWWRFHKLVQMEGAVADNDQTLDKMGEEYEALAWELAVPRALLPVLRHVRVLGGELPEDLEEMFKADWHGRCLTDGTVDVGKVRQVMGWALSGVEKKKPIAIEDIEKRLKEAEETTVPDVEK